MSFHKNCFKFQSLGILASIPAAILILALVGLLLYLLTRCCDRKTRKSKSQACQKCTLITTTLFCCAAIGLGLYGNDDFHNGILQAHGSGKQIIGMLANFTNRVSSYCCMPFVSIGLLTRTLLLLLLNDFN